MGPIRGTSARQNGYFSFSYSLLLLPPPSLTSGPTPGPTPNSPTLILIPIPISTPISPTPSPTSTPSLPWNLYGGPIRRECGEIPCDHGPPNAQVAIRRVYVARGSMGPGVARVLLPVPTRPPKRRARVCEFAKNTTLCAWILLKIAKCTTFCSYALVALFVK